MNKLLIISTTNINRNYSGYNLKEHSSEYFQLQGNHLRNLRKEMLGLRLGILQIQILQPLDCSARSCRPDNSGPASFLSIGLHLKPRASAFHNLLVLSLGTPRRTQSCTQ